MSIEGPAFLHLKSFSSFMHNCVPYITSNFPTDRWDRLLSRIYLPEKIYGVIEWWITSRKSVYGVKAERHAHLFMKGR